MTQDVQTWMDKLELLELCNKYAQGADNPDMDLFFSVFTDDVEMEYAGLGRTYRGLAEYRQALTTGPSRVQDQAQHPFDDQSGIRSKR